MKFFTFLCILLFRLRNAVDYPLRQFFRWRRNGLRLKKQSGEHLFAHLVTEERKRAEELAERLRLEYHLEFLRLNSSSVNYRENLYYLHMLEEGLNRSGVMLPEIINVADIGPSHWFYVQSLYALLRWWNSSGSRVISLKGYEVDAFRIYNDLYSRADHAYAHIRTLAGVEYIPSGFTKQENQYHLITMLFPFVFEKDHLEWGLPSDLFCPNRLLQSAWASLKPGGILMIVNQGIEEHEAQKARLQALGMRPIAAFRQDPLLFQYTIDRYVLVCRHD